MLLAVAFADLRHAAELPPGLPARGGGRHTVALQFGLEQREVGFDLFLQPRLGPRAEAAHPARQHTEIRADHD